MKERLTGAIILVALIVLLVPELLTGPVRPAARMPDVAQPAEGSALRSYTIELNEEAGVAQPALTGSPAPTTPAPTPTAPLARATAPAAAPAAAQTGATAPPAAAARAVPPSRPRAPQATPVTVTRSAGKGWMVQLGSFADHANAERLARQLAGRGFRVSILRGTTGRRLYRVRVGPTRDRAGALQLVARLRAAGHSGSIIRP